MQNLGIDPCRDELVLQECGLCKRRRHPIEHSDIGFDNGDKTHVLSAVFGRVVDAYWVPAYYPGVHMSSTFCVESSMCSLGILSE